MVNEHARNTAPMPADAPAWARALFQQMRDNHVEIELLREAVGCHVVSRRQAAEMLGKSEKTLRRYEDRGLLERVNVTAPGVHYDFQTVLGLKRRLP